MATGMISESGADGGRSEVFDKKYYLIITVTCIGKNVIEHSSLVLHYSTILDLRPQAIEGEKLLKTYG